MQAREQCYQLRNFRFLGGGLLESVDLNCAIWGTPRLDPAGRVVNAVLLCHGTAGSWQRFAEPWWSEQMFGPGQPLDLERYLVIAPASWTAWCRSVPAPFR